MLKAGDKLDAVIECPACGGGASMSVTKNMTIFAYCKEIVDPEKNEKCGYRAFLGRMKSREIIREYNEKMKGIENVQTEYEQEQGNIEHNQRAERAEAESGGGGDNTARAGEGESFQPAPPVGGISGAIKHFLTARE